MKTFVHEVKQCTLFRHMTVDALWKLLQDVNYKMREYKRGEVIFSPHDHANTLGILLSGQVEVQKIFSSGRVITINRRQAPDLIADAALFADTCHYPSTITSCGDSRLMLLSRDVLIKLFEQDPVIMTAFLTSVSNRVMSLSQTIELYSFYSVSAKIAYYLCHELKKQQRCHIKLNMTKKALAEQLNVSRPTLSRELKKLKNRGIISLDKRNIIIHCTDSLESLCEQ